MPSTDVPDRCLGASVDEDFCDVVCADDELLRAEFESIIAAQWPHPPENPTGRGTVSGHPDSSADHPMTVLRGSAPRPRRPGIGGRTRQRSPPPRRPTIPDRKGR